MLDNKYYVNLALCGGFETSISALKWREINIASSGLVCPRGKECFSYGPRYDPDLIEGRGVGSHYPLYTYIPPSYKSP
jgi:hypothetical protein